jgi:HrpA-like RNA helicase
LIFPLRRSIPIASNAISRNIFRACAACAGTATRAVEAFEERRFDAIVLERRSVPATPEDAVPALLAAVRELGLVALPWSEHATALRRRVNALREWNPALGLPDYSDAALLDTLEDWLAPYLSGKRRLDALQASELSEALSARLDHAMRARSTSRRRPRSPCRAACSAASTTPTTRRPFSR